MKLFRVFTQDKEMHIVWDNPYDIVRVFESIWEGYKVEIEEVKWFRDLNGDEFGFDLKPLNK